MFAQIPRALLFDINFVLKGYSICIGAADQKNRNTIFAHRHQSNIDCVFGIFFFFFFGCQSDAKYSSACSQNRICEDVYFYSSSSEFFFLGHDDHVRKNKYIGNNKHSVRSHRNEACQTIATDFMRQMCDIGHLLLLLTVRRVCTMLCACVHL